MLLEKPGLPGGYDSIKNGDRIILRDSRKVVGVTASALLAWGQPAWEPPAADVLRKERREPGR